MATDLEKTFDLIKKKISKEKPNYVGMDEYEKNDSDLERDKKYLAIEQRKEYAEKSFRFMFRYTIFATMILIADGLDIFDIGMAPSVALMGTISASMVLFGWVLKGVFDEK